MGDTRPFLVWEDEGGQAEGVAVDAYDEEDAVTKVADLNGADPDRLRYRLLTAEDFAALALSR